MRRMEITMVKSITSNKYPSNHIYKHIQPYPHARVMLCINNPSNMNNEMKWNEILCWGDGWAMGSGSGRVFMVLWYFYFSRRVFPSYSPHFASRSSKTFHYFVCLVLMMKRRIKIRFLVIVILVFLSSTLFSILVLIIYTYVYSRINIIC